MDKPPARRVYEFGEFRIDAAHLMLYRGISEIPLAPKAAETLLALIERRGEILSKDELLEAVWPDAIVEESNLFVYLSVLRKTLGTQENGNPWVETLKRRGYRFNGDVRLLATDGNGTRPPLLVSKSDDGAAFSKNSATEQSSSRDARSAFAAVALLTVILATAFSYSYLSRRPIGSIAVMPFANENVELEYLADGMTDNLIGSLSKIPGLEVKARSTMFRYKGSNMDAATIGRELNVEAVLSPRIVQRGDDFRLYLELVDTKTENSLWHETYDRKLSQLSFLERDIARDVVGKLRINIADATKQKITRSYTENAKAYDLFLRGQWRARKLTPPDIYQGIAYLWQAIEHDPSYAPAYAAIANAYRGLTLCCDGHPSELLQAKEAAAKALELDDQLAEAHSALGTLVYSYDWNVIEAEYHFLRALELDPNSSTAHFQYADFLGHRDRTEEQGIEMRRALELEPMSPFFNAFEAVRLAQTDPDAALERVKVALELDPNYPYAHLTLAGAYSGKKMYPEAIAEYRRAKELAPDQTLSDVSLSRMLVGIGEIDQARAILDELLRRSKSHYVPPLHIASVYNQLGDSERAIAWLEEGFRVRDPKMPLILTRPGWKKHANDPRFRDIKRRVGL